MDERDTPARKESRPLSVVLANLALVATASAFVTVAVRALVVARLDPSTAGGLVRASGPVTVFAGTMTAAFPGLLIAALVAFFYWARSLPEGGVAKEVSTSVSVALLIFSAVAAPWPAFVAIAAAFCFLVAPLAHMVAQPRAGGLGWGVIIGMASVPLSLFVVSSGVWVPQEKVQVEDFGVVYGYVLEEEGRWVSVLQEQDRKLLFLAEAEVESRQVCETGESVFEGSIFDVLRDLLGEPVRKPDYPPCDE